MLSIVFVLVFLVACIPSVKWTAGIRKWFDLRWVTLLVFLSSMWLPVLIMDSNWIIRSYLSRLFWEALCTIFRPIARDGMEIGSLLVPMVITSQMAFLEKWDSKYMYLKVTGIITTKFTTYIIWQSLVCIILQSYW